MGDPSGRSSTRPVLSGEEIDANARTYQEQALRVLARRPGALEVRRNREWLDMPMEELFRLARTTTVAQLLERDDFARRYAAAQPISVLELLYPLLQGYDSVAVRADVELGGTDQTFNLLLGRDVQRAYGEPEQVVLTMPILPGTRRRREDVEVARATTSASPSRREEMYGKTMRLPDEAMADVVRRCSALPRRAGRRVAARRQARARARRSSSASTGADAARGGRGALRPRLRRATRRRTRCRGRGRAATTGTSTCRR